MTGTSLRLLLLQRLLPAMLALLLAGAATAYWVAWAARPRPMTGRCSTRRWPSPNSCASSTAGCNCR